MTNTIKIKPKNKTKTRSIKKIAKISKIAKIAKIAKISKKTNPYNKIRPTEGESIFDAYLAVLTEILGEENIYKIICHDIPIFSVCKNYCTEPWDSNYKQEITSKSIDKFIFYCGINIDGVIHVEYTHYKLARKEPYGRRNVKIWQIIDPYHLYQISGSHGFCQMFAYFIGISDTNDFVDITSIANDKKVKKQAYLKNTYECLKKTLLLIDSNDVLKTQMSNVFQLMKPEKKWGIEKNMTFTKFLTDLKNFKMTDMREYIDFWYK